MVWGLGFRVWLVASGLNCGGLGGLKAVRREFSDGSLGCCRIWNLEASYQELRLTPTSTFGRTSVFVWSFLKSGMWDIPTLLVVFRGSGGLPS